MRIALYQCTGSGSVASNLDIMAGVLREAASAGAQLVVFPEMFLTGYNIGDDIWHLAETADGPSAQKAAAMAKEAGVALCFGFPERAGDAVYNSLLLVDASGRLLTTYRKVHLYGSEENRLFTPGEEIVLTRLEGWNVGLAICYDTEFPEMIRAQALAGAELILSPTALMEPYGFVAETLIPARCIENQVYMAYGNRCGSEGNLTYCGQSCIVAPDGRVLALAGKVQKMLFAELNKESILQARRSNPYLQDRRPGLYTSTVRWV